MLRYIGAALLCFLLPAAAQPQLQFGDASATYTRILPLANKYGLIGTTHGLTSSGLYNAPVPHYQIAAYPVGSPPLTWPRLGGSGNDIPKAAAFDPSGNLWIAGQTDSDDFPLVDPIVSQKVPYRPAGFVMEVDPSGKTLFSTFLCGQKSSTFPLFSSAATALAIDRTGNVYVGGQTDEPDFPATPGAFLTGKGGADTFFNTYVYSFALKISPAGKLIYSTLLGTGKSACVGGSHCINGESTSQTVTSLEVDTAGALTASGISAGAYNPGAAYITRLGPDGSKLLWTMTVPISYGVVPQVFMAQDGAGNLDLFGEYITVTRYDPFLGPQLGVPGLFAAQVKPDGSSLAWSTDLGASSDASAAGIAIDPSGNAWLAGTSSSAQFPAIAGERTSGTDFVLKLDASGAKPQSLLRFPRGVLTAVPAFDMAGNLLLIGAQSALLTWPPNYAFDKPAIVGFANAASYALNTGITAGALLTIFGFDLPPSPQVLVGGISAPVLYSSPTQINLQVPFATQSMLTVPLQVVSPEVTLSLDPPPHPSIGIFTTDGIYAAALNQDGTVNSLSNPAAPGSIISLFGTGAAWPSGSKDGAAAPAAFSLDQGANGISALLAGYNVPLNILYFGSAPGLIEGVFQMNVQLPANPGSATAIQLESATLGTSNAARVYVQ